VNFELNSRERVVAAAELREPDRVPLDISILREPYENLKESLGIHGPDPSERLDTAWNAMIGMSQEALRRLHIDIVSVLPDPPKLRGVHGEVDGTEFDQWGVGRRWIGSYNEMVFYPLGSVTEIDEVEEYDWPRPDAFGDMTTLRRRALALAANTDFALSVRGGCVFERSWYLVGLQKFLKMLMTRRKLAESILDHVLRSTMEYCSCVLDEVGDYVQIVKTNDDLGTQNGPLLSPTIYREVIMPRHKKLFDLIRSKTDAKIFYHSCGSIRQIIPDLIKAGIDILNPIQPFAKDMNPEEVKKEFGSMICFHGGVDIQRVLPFGSTEDIKLHVRELIKWLGQGGGYMLAPAHNIQPDVTADKIIALYDSAYQYGRYPL